MTATPPNGTSPSAADAQAAMERRMRALRAAHAGADELDAVAVGRNAYREYGMTSLEEAGERYAEAVANAERVRFVMRETALAAHDRGVSSIYIARLCGVSRNTVNTWVAQAREDAARDGDPA